MAIYSAFDRRLVESLDEQTEVIYLSVPGSKIVLLQGFFELYEEVAIVRTISVQRSLVCVLTPRCMLDRCLEVLEAIRPQIGWEQIARPAEAEEDKFLRA